MDPARNNIEDKFRECFKVINSFLYFIMTYCWIEDKITLQAIPFKLWPSQQKIIPTIVKAIRLIILKARQLGLTWIIAAYCLWLAITKPLQQILVISYNQDVAQEFLGRIKFMLTRLPEWLYPSIKRDTTEFLEFCHYDKAGKPVNSVIQSLPTTPKGGQSKTPTLMVVDESAWNQYFKEIYSATEPGIEAAAGRIIIISNAMKRAPGWAFTRELFTNSMKGLNNFVRIFMPWWDRPGRSIKKVLDPETKEMIPQFIYSEKYEKNKDDDTISEHYPATEAEAISVIGGSYFGNTLIRHQNALIKGITGSFQKNKFNEIEFIPSIRGIIELWRYPYHLVDNFDGIWWEDRYAVGSDISEGLGETFSNGYVIDRKLDEFVCRIRSNRIDAYEWADQLFMASQYYKNANGNAVICPERTGAGITTCKHLQQLDANLYVKIIPAKAGNPVTKVIGWEESEKTKHDLCGDLKTWLRQTKGNVYCALLIDECSTFIKHETGKLGHEEGKFDDCVMGAGCTIQASHFIGGSPKAVPEEPTGWMKKWQEGRL